MLAELALGARHGIVFPRELMLLARCLVNLEATAMIVDPQLNLAELARPLLPELRHILRPGPEALQEHWNRYRFEYLDLAAELPALLPEAIARLREQPHRRRQPRGRASGAGSRWPVRSPLAPGSPRSPANAGPHNAGSRLPDCHARTAPWRIRVGCPAARGSPAPGTVNAGRSAG